MLKWKRILNFLRLLPHLWFILGLRWPWLMLKRQLDNIAPLQMSQMCFKSCWRAEGSLEQLILGHLKWEDWETAKPKTHRGDVPENPRVQHISLQCVCWTIPQGWDSLGTARVKVAQQPSPGRFFFLVNGIFWVVFGSSNPFSLGFKG